jgi:hypothetical protein
VAFVLLGLAFGFAYTRNRLLTAAIAVAGIGGIEILQLWAPGRHARLEGFITRWRPVSVSLSLPPWIGRDELRRANAGAS